jgi:hypothetical protein
MLFMAGFRRNKRAGNNPNIHSVGLVVEDRLILKGRMRLLPYWWEKLSKIYHAIKTKSSSRTFCTQVSICRKGENAIFSFLISTPSLCGREGELEPRGQGSLS